MRTRKPSPADESPRRAERKARATRPPGGSVSGKRNPALASAAATPEKLCQELQIHQVELEAQNEELRLTQQLLEQSRDRYADLYDFAPVAFVSLDEQGVIQEMNLTGAAMLGQERSRLYRQPFALQVAKPSLPVFRQYLRDLVSRGSGATVELNLICKVGGTLEVELRGQLVPGGGDRPGQIRCTMTDVTARKRAERSARATAELNQDILDSLQAQIAVLDNSGIITAVNIAWARFGEANGNGTPERSGVGVNYLEVCRTICPAASPEAEQARAGIQAVLDGSRPIFSLTYECSSTKERRWFQMSVTPRSGAVGGAVVSHTDVSERIRGEKALRESEERLRLSLEAGQIGTFEIELKTGKARWNSIEFNLLGLAPGSVPVSPETFFQYVHPEDVDVLRCAWENSLKTGKLDAEFRIIRADGAERWLTGRGSFVVRHGQAGTLPDRFLGVNFDITERKQAEEAVARSEHLLARTQALAHVGSYEVMLPPNKTSYWSVEMCRILGQPTNRTNINTREFIAKMVHPDDRERVRVALEQVGKEGGIYDIEYRIVRPDGSIRQVHSLGDTTAAPGGQGYKLTGSLQDITERRQLEAETLKAIEQEQSRIGQDLHDGLCQHLAGIEFRLLALKQKIAAQSTGAAIEETAYLAQLARQAIEQSRTLARGMSPVMMEENGLMDALQELAAGIKNLFQRECAFHCPVPISIPDNKVATHLYRIAQEAAHNAIRHGKAQTVQIRFTRNKKRLVLEVKDDGNGFSRQPTKPRGMGMRVMQYRAAMVGGSLVVRANPDGGVSVICSLPEP